MLRAEAPLGTQEAPELRIRMLSEILSRTPPSTRVVELLEKAVNQHEGEHVRKRGESGRWWVCCGE